MTRALMTLLVVLSYSAAARADVTITTVISVEGGMSAMTGGVTPRMVMRIKGLKGRSDVDAMGQVVSTLVDLAGRQVVVLHTEQKTATVVAVPPGQDVTRAAAAVPKVDATFTPTGRRQTISGVTCDEYAFTMQIAMNQMGGAGQMPPQAAEMLQDARMLMNGSVWTAKTAPGASEYLGFQKAALQAQFGSFLAGTAGTTPGGVDAVMRALSGAEGMPYLTEITMTFEGAGPAVEMMKQMGGMKVTSKITDVSTDSIPDAMFTIPADYQIVKQ